MSDDINRERRRFLATAVTAIAAGEFGARRLAAAPFNALKQQEATMTTSEMASAIDSPMAGELAALNNATTWINSTPLTAASLRGKVVLVDFWTYTCINWLRTLPYTRAWAAKYKSQGLVVIGVHSPEFAFEKNLENVRRAVKDMKIDYPVAVDNEHAIWRGFSNAYWPALYLLDGEGRGQYHQFGEGKYDESEKMIQRMLRAAGAKNVDNHITAVEGRGAEAAADWDSLRSGENYLGYERTEHFASPGGATPATRRMYAAPTKLQLNEWALSGDWTTEQHSSNLNKAGGKIAYRFHARDVHLVMGPSTRGNSVRFRVFIDGQPATNAHGVDVDALGNGVASEQRMYQLIRQHKPISNRLFEIEFLDAGIEAYAFTFG